MMKPDDYFLFSNMTHDCTGTGTGTAFTFEHVE